MMKSIKCEVCTKTIKCDKCQLELAYIEIDKLKESIKSWKDAWFNLRDSIGWLWWHHPAINSNDELQYYQKNLERLKENKNV